MIEQLQTPISKKAILYERAAGRCQYIGGCDVTDFNLLTIDHIKSRKKARKEGLIRADGMLDESIYDLNNLQLVCKPHHILVEIQRNKDYR